MKKTFHQSVLDILRGAVEEYGSAAALSAATGVSPANISYWLSGKRTPRLAEISVVLDALGVKAISPGEDASREVCFVNARKVDAGGQASPPNAEAYLAVPVVGEVGAGPGYFPEDGIKSWFLVWKYQPAVRNRNDLIAVEIGKSSTSMQPTLRPGDIVLVDRSDRNVDRPGHIMLVRDPDGCGKVKRVDVQEKDRDYSVIYYSDNALDNPPEIYSLRKDFDGEFGNAIVGRVVWAWSDISNK